MADEQDVKLQRQMTAEIVAAYAATTSYQASNWQP
jgi:hypothetical protein